jgi:hypothetical protein
MKPLPLIFAAVLLAGPALAASSLDEALSYDGLVKTSIKGVDLAYVRPGASLAGYTSVQIGDVGVTFHKSWDPTRPGSRFKLTQTERQTIRDNVAKLVREAFVKTLEGGYPVVTSPGPDTLGVQIDIANLYVNAPDIPTSGRSISFSTSAGQMTLVLQLYDSETGEVIARVVDREDSQIAGRAIMTSGAFNAAEGDAIASAWARTLKRELDAAKGG